MKRALARRIYAHLLERGYIERGSVVVDPFAGICGFALHAMQNGLHWVGVELEEKFVGLGQQNLDLWNRRFSRMPHWGTAVLLQGDSRRLCEVVNEAAMIVSSPPFGKAQTGGTGFWKKAEEIHDRRFTERSRTAGYLANNQGETPGQLAAMPSGELAAVLDGAGGLVSSPPYAASIASDDPDKRGGLFRDPKRRGDKTLTAEYGDSKGQLGAMREGEHSAIVSSPPYSAGTVHGQGGIDATKFAEPDRAGYNTQATEMTDYGTSDGQLAAMPAGDVIVSSPPFEESLSGKGKCPEIRPDGSPFGQGKSIDMVNYGTSQGQLGTESGTTFWSAARIIMEQCHQVLAPGAVAVWVCKRFVRNKQIVEFSQQWAALGEACGFETVEWVRAWLTEDRGNARALFDFEVETKKGCRIVEAGDTVHDAKNEIKDAILKRSSFFRKLYEDKYPGNSIDWEDVVIQKKL